MFTKVEIISYSDKAIDFISYRDEHNQSFSQISKAVHCKKDTSKFKIRPNFQLDIGRFKNKALSRA